MISLLKYDEFGPNMGFEKMTDYFEQNTYENKESVIFYLKNGTKTYVSASKEKDVFTGETIPGECCGMTDGEYSWNSVLPYYVEKYNLRLPKDFENKAIKIVNE